MVRYIRILIVCLFITRAGAAIGQSVYVNTQQGIYQLNGGPGNCQRTLIAGGCGIETNMLSIAIYKDTLYYTTWIGQLRRFKIGVPGSCEELISAGPVVNAMTVDKNGILYLANEKLFKYDPYNRQLTDLGQMPFVSMGDLAFYKDKLLLAGYDPADWSTGIFEININHLDASDLFMSTPSFFGLISYPVACGNSRYFGLSSTNASTTQLMELDLVNKTVTANTCIMPLDILDAASSTETGLDTKVNVTDLQIVKACQSSTASVRIQAVYPGSNNLTYTLDNNITNTTGQFVNVPAGQHDIKVVAPGGTCAIDTQFSIEPVFDPIATVVRTNPDYCAGIPGSIKFSAPSSGGPFTYTLLNSGTSQPSGEFSNLRSGQYQFRISNASGCSMDTSIALAENIPVGGCNDVFIPNAFTPNNDGKNDLFNIKLPSSFKNVSLQVFGRWGNQVCQAKGNNSSWDGSYRGAQQPVGIYIYTLSFTDPSGLQKNLKGTLTLIR